MSLREHLAAVVARQNLTHDSMREAVLEITEGRSTDMLIAAFLVALRMKGETIDEITAAAEIMHEKVIPIACESEYAIDTCGTGGDRSGTFNISTAAAILASAAGAVVAKHGNRSISSACGSADVLKALGVNIELTPEQLSSCLRTNGFAFLFAPLLHPAMKYVMPARRELGIRTIFNILGPLTNPAKAKRHLLGVYDAALVQPVTETLKNLGSVRAFVVHGSDGLDEITLTGPTSVGEIENGKTRYYEITPADYGFATVSAAALKGGDAAANAAIIQSVMEGKPGPQTDIAVLNAAFALVASGVAPDVPSAVTRINETIYSGAARHKLSALQKFAP
ncbi:MAG: anthranilate phosphoribosyltransferase [Spirochaetes bacterium]|nr:anthranilate phosphoribosyltransferase [Spirochaetota bacterium]